jgi:hypothetical protein
MSFDIIIIGITLFEDSLTLQIDPKILFNCIKIDISFDIIHNKLIFCAKEQFNDFTTSCKLSLNLTIVIEVPNS